MTYESPEPEATENIPVVLSYEIGPEGTLIVEGTVIESNAATEQASFPQRTSDPGDALPPLLRFAFGSAVLLSDEVGQRIVVPSEALAARSPESVLRPVSEWESLASEGTLTQARYMTLGAMGDARKVTARGLHVANEITDTTGKAIARVAGPVWNSFLFAPVRGPVHRMRLRGEQQVQDWISRGRIEESRSRSLAQASLTGLVSESVTDLTASPQIQVLVQDVIRSQSTSIVSQVVEEIRERFISIDMVIAGTLGETRAPQPDFRQHYLTNLAKRRPQYAHADLRHTMAGTYAGYSSRVVAFLIDVVILLIGLALASSFITSTLSLFGVLDLARTFLSSGSTLANISVVLLGLANVFAVSGYGVLFWSLTGETPGHLIMGLQVVDKNGDRLSFWQAVRRIIGAYVAGVVLLLGFIWPLFDKRRQGWHDKIGSTFVLYDWPGRPEENFLREQVLEELAEDEQ